MCVKTGEIQIRSIPELMVLYQSQFRISLLIMYSGYIRYYHWRKLVERFMETLSVLFLKLVMSISKFFNYVF